MISETIISDCFKCILFHISTSFPFAFVISYKILIDCNIEYQELQPLNLQKFQNIFW